MRPTAEEIIKALRCSSTVRDHEVDCAKCAYYVKQKPVAGYENLPEEFWCQCDCDKIALDAADLIEEMTR